jgi:hypothetical protein
MYMNFMNIVLCAGIIASCIATEQNILATELTDILVSDTLDLLVNGSQAGTMAGNCLLTDSTISTQQTVSVNQNGQNVVNLLEKRDYNITGGGLTRAYQKMTSPSGSSIWELGPKKGTWELTVTTAGVRNARIVSSVYDNIKGTLWLYKGIKNKSIIPGDFRIDTLIELTSGQNIYATTTCKEVPSGANQYRWVFTEKNSLQDKEERWELDTSGHSLYHETALFVAVKPGSTSLQKKEEHAGESNLFTTFMVTADQPPVEGGRFDVILDSTITLDLSVAWMYEKSGTKKYTLKNTKCKCSRSSKIQISDSLRSFLTATPTLQVNHPEITALARKLSKKKMSICDKIADYTSYVAVTIQDRNTATFSSALETLRAGFGDCGEHAVLLAALLRASGIPARIVLGLVYMEPLKGYYGHAWVMAFDGSDWIFADPAHNVFPACTNRIPLLIDDSGQQMIQIIKMLGKISIEAE